MTYDDYFAPRTCTEIGEDGSPVGSERPSEQPSLPLEDFRESHAYVLLGGPGAGKTAAFRREAEGTGGRYVTARDFTTFDDRLEWHEGTLFIDGLDEMRARSPDGRTPFDGIRAKLDRLGRPRFRLSCREADWFGANDRNHLKAVSKDGAVKVLHLDPLSEDSIREILLQRDTGVEDVATFITTAHERGVETLLTNPQSLLMLAKAVARGEWPKTRTETFDLACGRLVREYNPEHQLPNQRPDVSEPDLLDAAGRLCAVQLLTGRAGYSLYGDEGDSGYLGLQQIPGGDQETFRHVLGTGLFESPEEGRMAPVHRQVAEFLAGSYLARQIEQIEQGLPVGRVLALITGHDGVVVSELRGLSAWLAAHCKTRRAAITERDPLGTVLYGDVSGFSQDEKHRLLNCLERETERNPWFAKVIPADPRLGDIATPDMADFFRNSLTDPARDDARQSFVSILLQSLKQGGVLPELTDLLVDVVRDNRWQPELRLTALDTFILHWGGSGEAVSKLKELLTGVNDGSVSDPDDDLLGPLLSALYPTYLSVPEVLRYLKIPQRSSHFGPYCYFWIRRLPEKSSLSQLAELLDTVVERFDELRPLLAADRQQFTYLNQGLIPLTLLTRFLETSQEAPSSERLFEWLGAVSSCCNDPWMREEKEIIRDWLSSHTDVQKEIIKLDAESYSKAPVSPVALEHRLFHAEWPPDFEYWCLDQAKTAVDLKAQEYFISLAVDSHVLPSPRRKTSRKVLEERIADNASLVSMFNRRLNMREGYHNYSQPVTGREQEREHESREKQQKWQDSVRQQAAALRENRCRPALLDALAKVYHGCFVGVAGNSPDERLRNLLGDDADLIEAVMAGLRGSIERDDVPDDAEIIRLRTEDQEHPLALPFLAGLEEIFRSDPADAWPRDEKQARQALAFHHFFGWLTPFPNPQWRNELFTSCPEIVADVLIRSVQSELRQGKMPGVSLDELESSPNQAKVVRLAALPLLKTFPVRCTEMQLQHGLRSLLRAALIHCEKRPFRELIERKLVHHSMKVAQRIRWLTAGLLVSPGSYIQELETYIAGKERRVRWLAEVVADRRGLVSQKEIQGMDAPVLELLIRLIGASYQPYGIAKEARWVTPAVAASEQVEAFIERLASIPSPAATKALERLSSNEALLPWRSRLADAAYRQSAVRREAEFHHCTVEQAVQTLDNLKPANAVDLATLATEHLREVAREIRDDNTSDWRQYWNADQHNPHRPQDPKPEDWCRDALLSDLRHRLTPLGIDAQPEGRYADDKRSDIRVSFGGFNVPVEIKRSSHRDLWSAIRKQLIPRYTRDPGADGHGIYLVFWFGRERCQTPESGRRPRDAAELEGRLRETLSPDEARKISICVVDVSPPPPPGAEVHGKEAERNGA